MYDLIKKHYFLLKYKNILKIDKCNDSNFLFRINQHHRHNKHDFECIIIDVSLHSIIGEAVKLISILKEF